MALQVGGLKNRFGLTVEIPRPDVVANTSPQAMWEDFFNRSNVYAVVGKDRHRMICSQDAKLILANYRRCGEQFIAMNDIGVYFLSGRSIVDIQNLILQDQSNRYIHILEGHYSEHETTLSLSPFLSATDAKTGVEIVYKKSPVFSAKTSESFEDYFSESEDSESSFDIVYGQMDDFGGTDSQSYEDCEFTILFEEEESPCTCSVSDSLSELEPIKHHKTQSVVPSLQNLDYTQEFLNHCVAALHMPNFSMDPKIVQKL